MPAEKTRADALREYLTGALSDGGAQAAPNSSLGGYRSSSETQSLSMVITDEIPNIIINFVSGGNALGDGTLDAVDADTLRWKCFDGTYGADVVILNGETKILECALTPNAYIRVTRTSADDLNGTATISLSNAIDNVYSLDDAASAEALAGSTKYRGTIVRNEAGSTVINFKRWIGTLGTQQVSGVAQLGATGAGVITTAGSFATWPLSGWAHIKDAGVTREIVYYASRTDTVLTVPAAGRARLGSTAAAGAGTDTVDAVPGIAIGIDAAGVTAIGAAIQTIANENTAPVGVTWSVAITQATGLNIGTMASLKQVGFWIKRELPAGSIYTDEATTYIQDGFDS